MRQTKTFKPISAASGTIQDMLMAFEDKLDDVGASTKIQAGYDPVYRDMGGGLSEDGELVRHSDLQRYWDKEHEYDPVLQEYETFDDWFDETRRNGYLKEVYDEDVEGCGSIQAATITDMLTAFEDKLDQLGASTDINGSEAITGNDDVDSQIWDIAQRYTVSSPVSGDWDTENAHILRAIIDETGLSEGEAKSKLISVLGWDPKEVYDLSPMSSDDYYHGMSNVMSADSIEDVGEDYINELMTAVSKKMKNGSKTEYEINKNEGNILLTSVSRDGIVVEYTIPLKDLKKDLDTDLKYILDAVEES